jgi:hypothetical protein
VRRPDNREKDKDGGDQDRGESDARFPPRHHVGLSSALPVHQKMADF